MCVRPCLHDLSESALPMTTDDTSSLRGGKRFEQIGMNASLKLLESLLDGDLPPGLSAVVIVDACLGVGDMFFAWLERSKALRFPVYFVGATPDPVALEWFQQHVQEEMVEKNLVGSLELPGFVGKTKDPPSDVIMAAPSKPQLNMCSIRPGPTIAIPERVINEWSQHAAHAPEFQDIVKAVIEEFGEPKPAAAADAEVKETTTAASGPSPKKRRITEPLQVVAASEVPDTKLCEAALSGLKKDLSGKVMVRVDARHAWWIINTSEVKVTLAAGTVVAGFGIGSFQHQPRQGSQVAEVDRDKLLLYDASSCEIVLHNGKLESLGDLLLQKQTEKGKASICYHDVSVKAGTEANQFEIVRKHEVYFKPAAKVAGEEEGSDLKLNKGTGSFAALVPLTTLNGLKHAKVLWSVRWALKGLMPIKPHLCIFDEMVLDGGKAVKL